MKYITVNAITSKDEFTKKDITSIFNKIISLYKKIGFDLSDMKIKFTKHLRGGDGKILKDDEIPDISDLVGYWTNNSTIFIVEPEIDKILKKQKSIKMSSFKKDFEDYIFKIIAHELAHEIFMKRANNEYKLMVINTGKSKKFLSDYIQNIWNKVPLFMFEQEYFCEFLSYSLFENKNLKDLKYKNKGKFL